MGTAALWGVVLGEGTVKKGGVAGREKSNVYPGELSLRNGDIGKWSQAIGTK